MCKELKCVTVILLLLQLILQVKGQTWVEHEGRCYAIVNFINTYNTCTYQCQQYGASMVELESTAELQFVQSMIVGTSDQYWVGLNYDFTTKKYLWVNGGTEPIASLWMPGEPNQSGYCVRLATQSQATTTTGTIYMIADNSCTSMYNVICEKNIDPNHSTGYWYNQTSTVNHCPDTSYTVRSKLDCAINCSISTSCTGFQYTDQTRTCTPYKFMFNCTTKLPSYVTMYIPGNTRC